MRMRIRFSLTCIHIVERRRDDEAAAVLAAAVGCVHCGGAGTGCPVKPSPPMVWVRPQQRGSTGYIEMTGSVCVMELWTLRPLCVLCAMFGNAGRPLHSATAAAQRSTGDALKSRQAMQSHQHQSSANGESAIGFLPTHGSTIMCAAWPSTCSGTPLGLLAACQLYTQSASRS